MTQQAPEPDPRLVQKNLRKHVCALLKIDPATISPSDSVLVNRIGTLSLLTSDLDAAVLKGQPLDLPQYISASRELEAAIRSYRDGAAGAVLENGTAAQERIDALYELFQSRIASETTPLREKIAFLEAQLAESLARESAAKASTQPSDERTHQQASQPVPDASGERRSPWNSEEDYRAWHRYAYGGSAVVAPGLNIDPSGRGGRS
jgi:hypothetical protein